MMHLVATIVMKTAQTAMALELTSARRATATLTWLMDAVHVVKGT